MLVLCPLPTLETAAVTWLWVSSRDGRTPSGQGQARTDELPRQRDVILVLPPLQVRWHRLRLPPHPPSKRAALVLGTLEPDLLAELESVHAVLPTEFSAGQAQWCAVTDRLALRAWLQALRSQGLVPQRIVALCTPQPEAQALVWPYADSWRASLCSAAGVLHLAAGQAAADLGDLAPDAADAWRQLRCPSEWVTRVESAWPQVAVVAHSPYDLLLQAASSAWNLAQGEFRTSLAQRRIQWLQDAWRQLRHDPAWAAVRAAALVALLAALIVPPSLAWNERRVQAESAAQVRALVQATFPEIGLVLEPSVQMRRALDDLARSRGAPTANDLAPLLQQLAQAPQPALLELKWSDAEAQLRWSAPRSVAGLRATLAAAGWRIEQSAPDQWRVVAAGAGS